MKKLIILCLLCLTACNPLAKFQSPSVQLSNLVVLERDGFEQRFLLKLKVSNPNKMRLPIQGLLYQVRLNGFDLFSGNAANLPDINALTDTYIEIPVSVNLISASAVLATLLVNETPKINYQLNATFDLSGVLPDFRVQEKGIVDLQH